jgi:DNA-binding protein HU-beta
MVTVAAPPTVETKDRITKSDLVALVAERLGIPKTHAKKVIDAMVDVMIENISHGVKVNLTGFGAFELRESKARYGINPRTLERIKIPAARRPAFRAGAALKRAIDG